MKRFYFLLLLPVLFISCFEQKERNCEDFKNGTFRFETEIDGKKSVTIFKRQNDLQIETYENHSDTASVLWVNKCEFILKNLHPKTMAERKPLQMRILTTSKDSYTFEYSLVGDSKNKQQGVAIKIK